MRTDTQSDPASSVLLHHDGSIFGSIFVGIAGGTGSGKTTVANTIADGLPPGSVVMIEHDAYYKDHPELSFEQRTQLNYDHPDALDNDLLLQHLDELRTGRAVATPIYDYVAHRRKSESRRVEPAPVVICEGILTFVDGRLRERLDVKLFVDTDADIRAFRRIRRDMQLRGRDFESIREQYYRTVRPMHLRFVEPSKRWADVIIPEGGNNQVAMSLVIAHLRAAIGRPPGAVAESAA